MLALSNFGPEISGIKIQQLIPFYFDFTQEGPVTKKLQEVLKVLKEKKKRQNKDIEGIIREVCEANKCQSVEYKRRGKRKWLWGAYEAEPEEKISISIRGHFCAVSQT